MKKIIENLLYDTEASSLLGRITALQKGIASSTTDFKYWEETLYKTTKNRYFIHGEGGPMSPYMCPTGNNCYCSGEDIIPMSHAEAKDWAMENLEPDTVVLHFGIIEEA